MQIEEKMTNIDNACNGCIARDCKKKGTSGHLPGCPNDPEQIAYLEAFRLRFDGNQQK